jgi:hypothetical protein
MNNTDRLLIDPVCGWRLAPMRVPVHRKFPRGWYILAALALCGVFWGGMYLLFGGWL